MMIASTDKFNMFMQYIKDGDMKSFSKMLIEEAGKDDPLALEILERIIPSRPNKCRLPHLNTLKDCVEAMGHITDALLAGEITSTECSVLSTRIETKIKKISQELGVEIKPKMGFEKQQKVLEEVSYILNKFEHSR